MTATTKLMKSNGGYITTDGRYTVTPKIMGDSPRNKGHREWRVTDLDSGSTKMVSTLTAARDFIGGLTGTPASCTCATSRQAEGTGR